MLQKQIESKADLSIFSIGCLTHGIGSYYAKDHGILTLDRENHRYDGTWQWHPTELVSSDEPKIKITYYKESWDFKRGRIWPQVLAEHIYEVDQLAIFKFLREGITNKRGICFQMNWLPDEMYINSFGPEYGDDVNDTGATIVISPEYIKQHSDDFYIVDPKFKNSEEAEKLFGEKKIPYRLKYEMNLRSAEPFGFEVRSRVLSANGICALVLNKVFFEEKFRSIYEKLIEKDSFVRRPVFSPNLELLFE